MSETTVELSNLAKSFKPGIYRHFKGSTYEALFVARNSEHSHKEYVVYRSIYNGGVWVRPLAMFLEIIDRDGYHGPRFSWLRESN
ncbi:MAG TPA: DUF1653 domain-containing protein [Phycisphaerales bacterium]|nr:DUF1653 domain-containing protein [Phycisphaerales bacterium]